MFRLSYWVRRKRLLLQYPLATVSGTVLSSSESRDSRQRHTCTVHTNSIAAGWLSPPGPKGRDTGSGGIWFYVRSEFT